MSKTMKNLKNRMKAPHDLKEAVKKGERLERTYYGETPKAGARRSALALAGYACIAMLLLGSVIVLPNLLSAQAPVAESGTSVVYVKPTEDQLQNYVRPDLIWASDLNPQLKDFVIWSADVTDFEVKVTKPITLPDLDIEKPRYALEVRMEVLDKEDTAHMTKMKRIFVNVTAAMENIGAKEMGNMSSFTLDANNYPEYLYQLFEIGADQLTETAEQRMISDFARLGNTRIEIKIAEQPYDDVNPADYQIKCIWQAKQVDGEQTVWPMLTDHLDNDDYIVRFCVEDVTPTLDSKIEEGIQAKFDQFLKDLNAVGTPTEKMNDYPYRGENRYFYYDYVISKNDLIALDTESVVSQMSNVDGDIWCQISIFDKR